MVLGSGEEGFGGDGGDARGGDRGWEWEYGRDGVDERWSWERRRSECEWEWKWKWRWDCDW